MKFSCLLGGDTQKSWAQTIFEAKPVEIYPFRTERTISPKNAPCPKPLFSDRNWKFGQCQSGDIIQAAELAKFQIRPTSCPKVIGLGIFGPKNRAMPQVHYATPTFRILFRTFVAVGAPTESCQIHQADLLSERNEIWGPKFQRAQKRELGPKENKLMGAWQYCLGEIYPKKIGAGRLPVWPNTRSKQTHFYSLY